MHVIRQLVVALLVLLSSPATAQISSLSRAQVERIQRLLHDRMAAAHIPGASIAIGDGRRIIWSAGFGMADVENGTPARADTAYRTASIGKSMTATAAMQLAEQGRLDLAAPIQRYCPRYPAANGAITVRELISHTSGIRHYEGPTAQAEAYITRHYEHLSDAIDIFANDPLVQRPGADFHYSTWGYVVLGCVLEGASGEDFRSLMRNRIFAPAGMTSTRDDDPRVLIPGRASGYIYGPSGLANAPFADMSAKMAAGGFITTAPDLVRFMQRWMAGGYGSAATRAAMLTPYRLPGGGGTVDGFGMGWFLDEFRGHRAGLYGGSTAGVSGYIFFVPDLGLSIAILFNLEDFPGQQRAELVRAIADIVIPLPRSRR